MKNTSYRLGQELTKGFLRENPIFTLLLGMCPTLAVTSSATNGLGMGLSATLVLIASNVSISALKNFIPDKVRIPAYIVLIAGFVTILEMLLKAYLPTLHEALGLFIPLIVVNCIILGRAEAFAARNGVVHSLVDGVSMGLGFTFALTLLGSIREILGNGSLFDMEFIPEDGPRILLFILPPGAFITLGFLIALMMGLRKRMEENQKSPGPVREDGCTPEGGHS